MTDNLWGGERFPAGTDVVEGYYYKLWSDYYGPDESNPPSVYTLMDDKRTIVHASYIKATKFSLKQAFNVKTRFPDHIYLLNAKTEGWLEGIIGGRPS